MVNSNKTTLGQRLNSVMENERLSVAQLASLSGVSRQHIYNVLNDVSDHTDYNKVKAVAGVLDVDAGWLYLGKGTPDAHRIGDHIGVRIKQCMARSNIASVPILASELKIPKSYLYQLVNGDIAFPHKYFDQFVDFFKVNPVWLKDGRGSPYTDAQSLKSTPRPKTEKHTVLVGESRVETLCYIKDCSGLLTHHHPLLHSGDAHLYYFPETTSGFAAHSLFLVTYGFKPGPGIYLASEFRHGADRLFCVNKVDYGDRVSFELPEGKDYSLIGKIEFLVSVQTSDIEIVLK